jgi:hypothetical protein
MTKMVTLGMLFTTLGGCSFFSREPEIMVEEPYTKSQIDALSAEQQCKLLARNMVQIARCDVRR